MELEVFLDRLGYSDSLTFLRSGSGKLESAVGFGHIFRHAKAEPCNLEGVYTLSPSPSAKTSCVPIVYVCRAADEAGAEQIHRLVWNQDVAPFVLVYTPRGFKLYSGFHFRSAAGGPPAGMLRPLTAFNAIAGVLDNLRAESIDDGRIWQEFGNAIRPEKRVDWQLLDNLHKLDGWLQTYGLAQATSHALIGKYVFLHYLRDRHILSDRKLESWGIAEGEAFGRTATVSGRMALPQELTLMRTTTCDPCP